MHRFAGFLAVVVSVVIATTGSPAAAQSAKPYVTAREVDLLKLLAPPPASNSAQTKSEIALLLSIQATRTPEMEARARADAASQVWRFGELFGPKFSRSDLPKTAAFFARVGATVNPVVDPAKDTWKRQRPHQVSEQVMPSVEIVASASYPSGTATRGTLMAIVLANMVPEKRAEIMARGWELGYQRVIGGIHFPSDVEAGRTAGTLIALSLMGREDFNAEFEAARAELRAALGL